MEGVWVHNECPYGNLSDNKSVGEGKKFTPAQKKAIIQENMNRNGGIVKSDQSGEVLVRPKKSQKGITPHQMNGRLTMCKQKVKEVQIVIKMHRFYPEEKILRNQINRHQYAMEI